MSDEKAGGSPYFAAVDLGSNSFHMIIARIIDGQMEVVDRVKEMVQIARGVKADGHLSLDAQERALACLERFAERLRDIPAGQIRAVGTKTLRAAPHSKSFLRQAEKKLGVTIQIISGYEEARLVYTGLAHSVRNDHNRRLVVDIGGGSTEFIVGQEFDALCLESLSIGCVSYTARFAGKNGRMGKGGMKRCYLAACAEIEAIRKNYLKTGWHIAYGTSGTVRAIADLTQEKDGGAIISRGSLDWLGREIFSDRSPLGSVSAPRRSVLPAGIAILQAVFDQLKLDSLLVADATLKEGLLYDTIGRLSDQDSRRVSVAKLQNQYQVDPDHAGRVADCALKLWKQIDGPVLPGVSRTKILTWAAQLHEIGMSISHSGHHKNGYFILRYSDIAGFGRYEQYILANLVRWHRKSLSAARFDDMDEVAQSAFIPLLVCLRLSVLLHRRREDIDVTPKLTFRKNSFRLRFPPRWLAEHPLTLAGLEQEKSWYDAIGVGLEFR